MYFHSLAETQLFSEPVKAEKRLEVATVTPQWLVIDRNGWSKLYNEREVTGS